MAVSVIGIGQSSCDLRRQPGLVSQLAQQVHPGMRRGGVGAFPGTPGRYPGWPCAGCDDNGFAKVKDLEQEVREPQRANEILKRVASFFGAELDRQQKK